MGLLGGLLWLGVWPVLGHAEGTAADTVIVARIHKVSLRRGHTSLTERREVSAAAREVLLQVPDGVSPPFAVIQRELLRKQVIEPIHRQIVAGFATAEPGALLDAMEPMLEQALGDRKWRWFGVAVRPIDSERSRLLIVLVESGIDLVPPPAATQLSEKPVPLSGTVLAPYSKPQVLLTDPLGQVMPLPIVVRGREFSGMVRSAPR